VNGSSTDRGKRSRTVHVHNHVNVNVDVDVLVHVDVSGFCRESQNVLLDTKISMLIT
jgi:hypothetical protein